MYHSPKLFLGFKARTREWLAIFFYAPESCNQKRRYIYPTCYKTEQIVHAVLSSRCSSVYANKNWCLFPMHTPRSTGALEQHLKKRRILW